MAIMSQRAYARHRGVALYAVQVAIKKGRISTTADGQIDSDVADREWEANTRKDPPKVKVNSRRAADDDPDPSGESFSVSQYTKARAVREHYQARLAKLEYEEKVGSLVSKDEVKVEAYNKFRTYRDGMLNIPDRVSSVLAAESDAAKVHAILTAEIRKALLEFADAANG